MNWDTILLLVFIDKVQGYLLDLNRIIKLQQRRYLGDDHHFDKSRTQNNDQSPEKLPEAEPVIPGHTLIQPEKGMLKSSVKYPQESASNAVYGNMDQLTITYGTTPDRILYTGFRKANNLLDSVILQAIRNIQNYNGYEDSDVIVIESKAPYEKPSADLQYWHNRDLADEENTAREILDESSSLESEEDRNSRKSATRRRRKHRSTSDDTDTTRSSSVSSSSSESSDYDRNPGNPYTLHKGKYKQNYLWNHVMDGDHMNINPYGPGFYSPGPTGAELFFGRKWWYFNQDDFKPLR